MKRIAEVNVQTKAYCEMLNRGKLKYKSLHRCKKSVTWTQLETQSSKRIVAMSDIHGATSEVVHSLIKRRIIDQDTIVICTGDMGGENGKKGGLLDPTPDYIKIRDVASAFYFVQGNHDLDREGLHSTWINKDGTPCYLHRKVVKTPLGRIGGVSGIVAYDGREPDSDAHIYSKEEYEEMLSEVLDQQPDVLLTHTPLEKDALSCIHLFGHAHFKEYIGTSDTGALSLNMDSRIFVWN